MNKVEKARPKGHEAAKAIAESFMRYNNARGAARIAAVHYCISNGVPLRYRKTSLNREGVKILLRGDEREVFKRMMPSPIPKPSKEHPEIVVKKVPGMDGDRFDLEPIVEYAAGRDDRVAQAKEKTHKAEEEFKSRHPEFHRDNPEFFGF